MGYREFDGTLDEEEGRYRPFEGELDPPAAATPEAPRRKPTTADGGAFPMGGGLLEMMSTGAGAGAGRGTVVEKPGERAAYMRGQQPYRDKREAIDDAVDQIEMGAPPHDVYDRFSKLGVTRFEIEGRGTSLGGKIFSGGPGDVTTPMPDTPPEPSRDSMQAVEPGGMPTQFVRSVRRGAEQAGGMVDSASVQAGILSPSDYAEKLRERTRRMGAQAADGETAQGLEMLGEANQAGDMGAVLDAISTRQGMKGLVAVLTESMVASLAPVVPTAAARMIAGPQAAMATAFTGSFGLEFSAALSEELDNAKIDPSDVMAVRAAVENDEFMANVRKRGVIRGLAVGTLDAISMGFAGRFVSTVERAVAAGKIAARSARGAMGRAALKEATVQGTADFAGEGIGQAAMGEYKPLDLLVEPVAGAPGSAIEVGSAVIGNRAGALTPDAQLAKAMNADMAERNFNPADIDGFARAALTTGSVLTDPRAIRPDQTMRPLRMEEMPTTPISPEAVATMVATAPKAPAQAQGGDASLEGSVGSRATPALETVDTIGVAAVPQGAIADRAEFELQQNAQGNSDVGLPPATVPGPGRSGDGGSAVNVGGVAGPGPVPDAGAGVRAGAAAPVPADAAPGAVRAAGPAAPALSDGQTITPQPPAATLRDGATASPVTTNRVAGDRAGLQARYERERSSITNAADLREAEANAVTERARQLRVAGTPDARARADALDQQAAAARELSATYRAKAAELPQLGVPPAGKAAASFARVADAVESVFGRRPEAYFDDRPDAADGFMEDGAVYVNLSRPHRSIPFTVFHEMQHAVRLDAEAGNAQAQAATKMLDQVWGMIGEGHKRKYAEQYLFKRNIGGGKMTVEQALADPLLKDEMLSDFMGKRADDEKFMASLARKNPDTFGGFITRWIDALSNLAAALRGRASSGVKDVDVAIKDLERAKAVAQKVLLKWAEMNPQRAADAQQSIDIAQQEVGGRKSSARQAGVVVEVAPNPDKPEAESWRGLDAGERETVTRDVMDNVFSKVLMELGWPKATYTFGSGTFEGEVNPNVTISMPGASFDDIAEMARVMGYVLDQKAMVAFDESDRTNGSQAGFVKVIPPAGMSTSEVQSLRQSIARAVPQATGDTMRDGAIVYGNFSGFGDNPVTDEQFYEAIASAVDSMPQDIEVRDMGRFRSEYIEPASRDGYLEGTRYASDQEQGQAGRDGVRGRVGGDLRRLREIAERAVKRRDDRVSDAQRLRREGAGGVRQVQPEALQGPAKQAYGEPRQGAVEVDAFHYSTKPRSTLSTTAYGTGLRGSSTQEMLASSDPRLRKRAYFYANKGKGIHPEAGVGGHAHRVSLRNVYDQDSDPLKLLRGTNREAFEVGVLDAGFDGYLYRDHNNSAAVVLLGDHAVPVEYVGQHGAVTAGEKVLAAQRRNSLREGDELGAFNPFRDEVEEYDADAVDEEALLQAELRSEATGQGYTGVTAEQIKAAGIHPEDAFPDLEYQEADDGRWSTAEVLHRGDNLAFGLREKDNGLWVTDPHWIGPRGAQLQFNNVTRDFAEQSNKRVMASIELFDRGFDILSTVSDAQVKRISKVWRAIAKKPGAFELGTDVAPSPARQLTAAAQFNEIGAAALAGTGASIKFTAEKGGYSVDIVDAKGGESKATVNVNGGSGGRPYLEVHSSELEQGSGAGKYLYQVVGEFANTYGYDILADTFGLTGINTYRRTEQGFSNALRGDGRMQPGFGQRVYGWNPAPKTQKERDQNVARLALASLRNVLEVYPELRGSKLEYNLPTDEFKLDGKPVDSFDVLTGPNRAATSTSRSTLARAALTQMAMDGRLKPEEVIAPAKPVLYSAREPVIDDVLREEDGYAEDSDPFAAGYNRLEGRRVSFQVLIEDTGQVATVTADAAQYMRDLDERLATMRRLLDCLKR